MLYNRYSAIFQGGTPETNEWYTNDEKAKNDLPLFRLDHNYNNDHTKSTRWLIRKENGPYSVRYYPNYGGPGLHYITIKTFNNNNYDKIEESEVFNVPLTFKEKFSYDVKVAYAALLAKAGFVGPLPAGIGNGLRVLLKELPQYKDYIRKGFVMKTVRVSSGWRRGADTDVIAGPCYLFKSPIDGFNGIEFMKLCKLLKKQSKKYSEMVIELTNDPVKAASYKPLLTTMDALVGKLCE